MCQVQVELGTIGTFDLTTDGCKLRLVTMVFYVLKTTYPLTLISLG